MSGGAWGAWGPQPHQIGNPAYFRSGGDLPLNVVAPVLSIGGDGNPTVGNTLNVTSGDWAKTPIVFTYSWLRDGVVIPGQTTQSYTLATADIGSSISAEVKATNANGSVAKRTASTATVYITPPMFSDGFTTQSGGAVLSNNKRTVTWAAGGRSGSGVAASTRTYKWAVAARVDAKAGNWVFGLSNAPSTTSGINPSNNSNVSITQQGGIYNNSTQVATAPTLNVGDIVTFTLDGSTNGIAIYINGQNVYNTTYTGNLYPCWSDAGAPGAATLVLPYQPPGYVVWPSS